MNIMQKIQAKIACAMARRQMTPEKREIAEWNAEIDAKKAAKRAAQKARR